jgi:hypothetical protein
MIESYGCSVPRRRPPHAPLPPEHYPSILDAVASKRAGLLRLEARALLAAAPSPARGGDADHQPAPGAPGRGRATARPRRRRRATARGVVRRVPEPERWVSLNSGFGMRREINGAVYLAISHVLSRYDSPPYPIYEQVKQAHAGSASLEHACRDLTNALVRPARLLGAHRTSPAGRRRRRSTSTVAETRSSAARRFVVDAVRAAPGAPNRRSR